MNHDADLVFSTTEFVLYFGVQLECYVAWGMSVKHSGGNMHH